MSSLSRATDPSNHLINLGYNDIESGTEEIASQYGQESQISFTSAHKQLNNNIGNEEDMSLASSLADSALRGDDISLPHQTNAVSPRGDEVVIAENLRSIVQNDKEQLCDENPYFTNLFTRQY